MSGSAAGSKSKSKNSFEFGQDIPLFQQTALTRLYNTANKLFNTTNNQMQPLVGDVSSTNSEIYKNTLPALNNALQGGQFSDPAFKDQLMSSLRTSLNSPSSTQQIYGSIMGGSGNNYADAMKASFVGDANRATDNMLANLDARATASGMSGSSRHGLAQARGLYDINSNLQKNLADVGYNTFDKDLTNKLNIAQQADSNTLSRQQMLQQMLGSAQDTSNNAIGSLGSATQNLGMGTFAPFMAPWDALNNYAAAIGSPTVLSSGSGAGRGSSKGASASGGIK
jgi:hypothetical protein